MAEQQDDHGRRFFLGYWVIDLRYCSILLGLDGRTAGSIHSRWKLRVGGAAAGATSAPAIPL